MKQEIEYRAWIEKYKEMCQVLMIDFVNSAFCVLPYDELEGGNWILIENRMDLLQRYINKHDKNSKKIFIGDILKGYMIKNPFGKNPKQRNCLFIVKDSDRGYYLSLIDRNVLIGDYRTYPAIEDCEIIGNDCVNPELLKEGV